jgi:hypothetical protein
VGFRPNDWESRDAFAARVAALPQSLPVLPAEEVKEACALFWDDHEMRGTASSVDAMAQALHQAATVPKLKARIVELEAAGAALPVAPTKENQA